MRFLAFLSGLGTKQKVLSVTVAAAIVGLAVGLPFALDSGGKSKVQVSGGPTTTSTMPAAIAPGTVSSTPTGTSARRTVAKGTTTTTTTSTTTTTVPARSATGPVVSSPHSGTSPRTMVSPPHPGLYCLSPPGSDQGVTSTEIKVGVLIPTMGPESAGAEQRTYQEVIDGFNAAGGVACRQVTPEYFQVNPSDTSSLQQTCTTVVAAHLFFVIAPDVFDQYPALADCYAESQVPIMVDLLSQQQQSQYYPYLFGEGLFDQIYRNTVFGLAQRGVFQPANGFTELGLVYRDCLPQVESEIVTWLQQAGVASADVVTYDLGCPDGPATPSDLQQADLKLEGAHTSNVMVVDSPQDIVTFADIAQQRGDHYRYDLPDDGLLAPASGQPALPNTADGAIAITPNRYGEQDTAGMAPTAGTSDCNQILAAYGQPSVYQQPEGFGGTACDAVAMFDAAVSYSSELHRSALASGLQAAKSTEFSYPLGPNNFAGTRTTFGDEYWRVDQYRANCGCWQVVDQTFHPTFS